MRQVGKFIQYSTNQIELSIFRTGYDGVPIRDILEMSSDVKFNEEYSKGASDVMIRRRCDGDG